MSPVSKHSLNCLKREEGDVDKPGVLAGQAVCQPVVQLIAQENLAGEDQGGAGG